MSFLQKNMHPIIAIIIGLILFFTNKFVDGLFLSLLMFVGGILLITFGILKLIGLSRSVLLFLVFLILAIVLIIIPDPIPFIDELIAIGLTIKFGLDALKGK